jgi:hypothetical protein
MRLNKNFNRFVYGRKRIKEHHKNGKNKEKEKELCLSKIQRCINTLHRGLGFEARPIGRSDPKRPE